MIVSGQGGSLTVTETERGGEGGRGEDVPGACSFPTVDPLEFAAKRFDPFPLSETQQSIIVGAAASASAATGVAGGGAVVGGGVAPSLTYLEYDVRDVDVERLRCAWQLLVRRHGMLRTALTTAAASSAAAAAAADSTAAADTTGATATGATGGWQPQQQQQQRVLRCSSEVLAGCSEIEVEDCARCSEGEARDALAQRREAMLTTVETAAAQGACAGPQSTTATPAIADNVLWPLFQIRVTLLEGTANLQGSEVMCAQEEKCKQPKERKSDGDCNDGGGPESDGGGPESDGGGPESDGGGPESNGGGPESNGGGPESNGGGPESDGGGPESDGDGPESDGDGPESDGDGPESDGGGPESDGDGPESDGDGPESSSTVRKDSSNHSNVEAMGGGKVECKTRDSDCDGRVEVDSCGGVTTRAARSEHNRFRLHICVSSIIADGDSILTLLSEWRAAYLRPQTPLPPLHLTFRDYSLAERSFRSSARYQLSLRYWQAQLASLPRAPSLPLLTNQPAPSPSARRRLTRHTGTLEASHWTLLRGYAAQRGVAPDTLLLAAFTWVLGRWTSNAPPEAQSPFCVTVAHSDRRPVHSHVRGVVGAFTTTSLLRVAAASAHASFLQHVRATHGQVTRDAPHRCVSGVTVLRELQRQRPTPGDTPVNADPDADGAGSGAGGAGAAAPMSVPVVFTCSLKRRGVGAEAAGTGFLSTPVFRCKQEAHVRVMNEVREGPQGQLTYALHTDEAAFPTGVPHAMFRAYSHVLRTLTAEEGVWEREGWQVPPLSQLPAVSATNSTATLLSPPPLPLPAAGKDNGAQRDSSRNAPTTLHGLVLRQAQARPGAAAVIAPRRTLSYSQLDALSQRVASHLPPRSGGGGNAGGGELVAVVMNSGCWEQAVAIMAVLRSGRAYVPIAADEPRSRLRLLLEHCGARVVITHPSLLARHQQWEGAVSLIDVEEALQGTEPAEEPWVDPVVPNTALAYVLYHDSSSSVSAAAAEEGEESTALRAVAARHSGAVNTILDMNVRFGVACSDRVLAVAPLTSDLSVYDMFGLLGAGGALVLPSAAQLLDPSSWLPLCRAHSVTVWNSTIERVFDLAVNQDPDVPGPIRLALLSSMEEVQSQHLRAVFGIQCELVSLGGALECSLWSTVHIIAPAAAAAAQSAPPALLAVPHQSPLEGQSLVPYGRPMCNQHVYVLDGQRRVCPLWVAGAIHIGGAGVARGYWQDPAATAASFVRLPSGERVFRTGDTGLMCADGVILRVVCRRSNGMLQLDNGRARQASTLDAPPATPLERYPETATELEMACVWSNTLQLTIPAARVPVTSSFFELGGDSFIALQLVRAAAARGLPLTVVDVYQHRTIENCARLIDNGCQNRAASVALPSRDVVVSGREENGALETTIAYDQDTSTGAGPISIAHWNNAGGGIGDDDGEEGQEGEALFGGAGQHMGSDTQLLDSICSQSTAALRRGLSTLHLPALRRYRHQLTSLAELYIRRTLFALGVFCPSNCDDWQSVDTVVAITGMRPLYRPLIRRWLSHLARAGILQSRGANGSGGVQFRGCVATTEGLTQGLRSHSLERDIAMACGGLVQCGARIQRRSANRQQQHAYSERQQQQHSDGEQQQQHSDSEQQQQHSDGEQQQQHSDSEQQHSLGSLHELVHPRRRKRELFSWERKPDPTDRDLGPGTEALSGSGTSNSDHQSQLVADCYRRCGEQMVSVLLGAADPLPLRVVDSEKQQLAPAIDFALYSHPAVATCITSVAAAAMGALATNLIAATHLTSSHNNTPGSSGEGPALPPLSLSVLEVGAGLGDTTAALLPALCALAPPALRYTVSDACTASLRSCRERFLLPYPSLRYRCLDVERPPATQGFTPHSFDVVVAANVFHQCADVVTAVRNTRRLLRAGGVLLLVEPTAEHATAAHHLFTSALLPRWNQQQVAAAAVAANDDECHRTPPPPLSPLLSKSAWLDTLSSHGFDRCIPIAAADGALGKRAAAAAADDAALLGVQVIIARAAHAWVAWMG